MSLTYSHGREFVTQIRPFLERRDADGLVRYLGAHWPNESLRDLLSCGHEDAALVALACLSLTGRMVDNAAIAPLLNHEETSVYAEYALWAIWFRDGNDPARAELRRAVQLISESKFDEAIAKLNDLLTRYPGYAEAHNQRSIAYFLKEEYQHSLADCWETLRLNPYHFGAMAGVGHCHASMGELSQALEAYRLSLHLHPRLEGVRESVHEIRVKLGLVDEPSIQPTSTPTTSVDPDAQPL